MRQQEEGPHQQDEDEAAVLRVPGQECCLSASAHLTLSRTLFMYTGAVIEVIITSPLWKPVSPVSTALLASVSG